MGERLLFQVPLRLEPGEDIPNECLAGDVFLGDDKLPSASVVVSVQQGITGDTLLKLNTRTSINEPVITVYLVAGCKAKVTRKFVLLVDPPGMGVPTLGVDASAAPVLRPTDFALAAGPTDDPQEAAGSAKAPAGKAPSGPSRRGAPAGMSPALGASNRQGGGKSVVVAKASSGARLLLDPVEQEATSVPTLHMASAMGAQALDAEGNSPQLSERRAAAAAVWAALNATPEQLSRDRQRLVELEKRLSLLQKQAAEPNGATGGVPLDQFSLVPNWLLRVLMLSLLGALAALGWLVYKNKRKARRWWQGAGDATPASDAQANAVGAATVSGDPLSAFATPPTVPSALKRVEPSRPPSWALPTAPASAAPAVAPPAPAPSSVSVAPAEPLRAVSVEELIDLEQQAEFFVVLGQDEAAIDLLEDHVQRTTGVSPLPFLKLLEIYQRTGQRGDYERVQGAFNQRFNAYAPAWESDLSLGHSLSDYPGVVERIQSLWSVPSRAMDVLEKSITRPDNDAETFDLPAYRELLFLYAVARDLSERESSDRQSVDLLLPAAVSESTDELSLDAYQSNEVQPLMATRPVEARPEARPSLSLDLQLDDLHAPSGRPSGSTAVVTGPLGPGHMP